MNLIWVITAYVTTLLNFFAVGLNKFNPCTCEKTRHGSPLDNRPSMSTNQFHKFVQKKYINMWHMTRYTWHATHDSWGEVNLLPNFSSLALTDWDWSSFEDISTKDSSVNNLIYKLQRCFLNRPCYTGSAIVHIGGCN